MTKYDLDTLARKVRGCSAAEIVGAAKENGIAPGEGGLFEFPEPVMYLPDEETGEELPVFEVVSVEDARPEYSEAAERVEEKAAEAYARAVEAEAVGTSSIGTASNSRPYMWHTGAHPVRNFPVAGEQWVSNPGMMGFATRQIRMQNAAGGYRGSTHYYAYPYPFDSRQWSTWSPLRTYSGTPRILSFSSTVYANAVDVWWTGA